MNKALKIILITFLCLLAISIISVMVLLMNGKINFKGFSFNSTVSKKIVYDKTYDNSFDYINIKTEASKVEVKEANDNKIRLVIYDDNNKTTVDDTNNKLDINIKNKKCHFICINTKISKVVLYLPSDYENKITIDNDYGDILVGSFDKATLDINEDYGDIEIGSIYDITIREDYGDIKIGSVFNYLDIKEDYGDIKIDNVILNKNSKIENDLGDVKIGYTNNIHIDAKTDLGDVKIVKNYNSNITLKIRTDLGDIKVLNKLTDIKVSDGMKVIINDKEHSVNLENNETVKELLNLLPIEVNMQELNGNEKYVYLDNSLSVDEYSPKHINSGDIMLYGDNCLVIFYKSFDTIYNYTKIGHIDNLEDLDSSNILVKFEKK